MSLYSSTHVPEISRVSAGLPTGGLHSVAQIFLQVLSLGKGRRNERTPSEVATLKGERRATARTIGQTTGDGHSIDVN